MVKVIIILILYTVSLATVIATSHLSGYDNLLKDMTQENSFFESISVLLLFSIFIYGLSFVIKNKDSLSKVVIFLILGFSTLGFLAGMEEISWGQHIFHFQSSEYFLEQNHQKETNLHNLMNPDLFSAIINTSIYILLVFIPILYKLISHFIRKEIPLKFLDINSHYILITLFASVFQIYFYDNFGALVDMWTHMIALMVFAFYLIVTNANKMLKLHFLVILFSTGISMLHFDIYSFFNMQYEIREMFIVLASLLIFIEMSKKQKEF